MCHRPSGYRELEHTADWELEVWAPDLAGLFEQAARGMYALAGMQLMAAPRQERTIRLDAPDAETLLVAFLQELLYLGEMEGLGFDEFEIVLKDFAMAARVQGARIAALDKEIKAVTFHKLSVEATVRGLSVNIVFDV